MLFHADRGGTRVPRFLRFKKFAMPKFTLVFNVTGWVEGEIEAPNADAVDDMIDANPNCWKITKDGLT
jgi:hypothetical protein